MPLDFSSQRYKYSDLALSEDASETASSDLEKDYIERDSTPFYSKPLPWIISAVCLLLFNVALGLRLVTLQRFGTYSTGFVTEFAPATSEIEVVEVLFQGTLAYADTGRLYATTGPDGIRYVGKPTPDVDRAWEELIGVDETVQITTTEASQLSGNLYEDPRDGFAAGPDVLHTLHCVNQIRMLFDSEHYFNTSLNGLSRLARMHADHCLNHIRQSVQCHMDLTPHPAIYFESANVEVMDFDRVHTCRDIGKLRDWVKQRKDTQKVSESKLNEGGGAINGPYRGYISEEAMHLPWTW